MDKLAIFSGNSNPDLAKEISGLLKVPLTHVLVGTFSDGEIQIQIKENIRGKDVFVIQPTCPPVNDNLMELLILIDAARRASASRITAVIPYYGYARQDRKDQPRVPITAKLVANIILAAGANRVLTVDLHASQIQGFFDLPVDHLYAKDILCDYFVKTKNIDPKKLVVVCPDVGSLKMARAYSEYMQASLAVIDKRRYNPNETEVMHILGEVNDKIAILVDDIIATGSSLISAAEALQKQGVIEVYAGLTHGVFSGNALKNIKDCKILKEVVITNTIPFHRTKENSKIKVVSIASLLAEAIARIHNEESVSSLFS